MVVMAPPTVSPITVMSLNLNPEVEQRVAAFSAVIGQKGKFG